MAEASRRGGQETNAGEATLGIPSQSRDLRQQKKRQRTGAGLSAPYTRF